MGTRRFFWWFIGVVTVVSASFAALVVFLHIPQRNQTDASLVDILITMVTVSGITVPISIVYMTLGKFGDPFVSAAEATPFYLSEKQLKIEDLRPALLFWKETSKVEPAIGVPKCLHALVELTKFGPSPAPEYISIAAKQELIPAEHLESFRRHFEHGDDKKGLERWIKVVSVAGVLSFLSLCLMYLGIQLLAPLYNFLVVFTFAANVATYLYLMMMVRLKSKLRIAVLRKTEEFAGECPNHVWTSQNQSGAKGQAESRALDQDAKNLPKLPAHHHSHSDPSRRDG